MSLHPVGHSIRKGSLSGTTNHSLVERLREICASSDTALLAATRYNENFEFKLAECDNQASRERLISDWLQSRIDILQRTARDLKRVCDRTDP